MLQGGNRIALCSSASPENLNPQASPQDTFQNPLVPLKKSWLLWIIRGSEVKTIWRSRNSHAKESDVAKHQPTKPWLFSGEPKRWRTTQSISSKQFMPCRTPNHCLLTLAVCLARRNAKSGFRKDTQLSPGRLSRQSMLAWPSRFVTETKFHDKNASVTNADETKHGKLGAHGKSAEKNSRNRMRRGMIINTRT